MADIFISYKREDRERIAPLARALEARGYTVWWDLELVPSQKFERQIKQELDAAKCVIVVWTEKSVGDDGMYVSEWVQIEANSGDERGILLPVQLDEGRKHWRHGQSQFAALTQWTGDEKATGFVDLLRGVQLHAGPRERPVDAELADWQAAERAETAEAFRAFLARYPQSRFATIADGRVFELEELGAWRGLGRTPTIAALAAFLRRFPAGRFADDAETEIQAMELAGARAAPPPEGASSPRPPPRVQPEPSPEPSSQTPGLPKWLAPAGAAGLALVALLSWSPWNRSNPIGPEASPIVPAVTASGPSPADLAGTWGGGDFSCEVLPVQLTISGGEMSLGIGGPPVVEAVSAVNAEGWFESVGAGASNFWRRDGDDLLWRTERMDNGASELRLSPCER